MGTFNILGSGNLRGVVVLFGLSNIIYLLVYFIFFGLESSGIRFVNVGALLIVWIICTFFMILVPMIAMSMEKKTRVKEERLDEYTIMLNYPHYIWNEMSYNYFYIIVYFYSVLNSVFFLATFGVNANPPTNTAFPLADPIIDRYQILMDQMTLTCFAMLFVTGRFMRVYVLKVYEPAFWSDLYSVCEASNYIIEPIKCSDDEVIRTVAHNLYKTE